MNKYIIEYWKAGLPHKTCVRYARNVDTIPCIDYILAWYYKMRIFLDGKLVATWCCDD